MSILIDRHTKVMVQGITGRDGAFHAASMRACGTQIVAGVTPGKGGQTADGVPVFNAVAEAVEATSADCSVLFVPARFAAGAVREAIDAGIPLVVCITEGIPALQMTDVCAYVAAKGARLIGPNCPGLITPGQAKAGIMPAHIHRPGGVGVISRSGTLTYEVVYNLTSAGLGQSTCIGIGGDPVVGTGYIELLDLFEQDSDTEAIVLIGEIGGQDEERAAAHIRRSITKPVVAFIAGRTAPPGKRMGHAGAIIAGGKGGADDKVAALEAAGVNVTDRPDRIPEVLLAGGMKPNHG